MAYTVMITQANSNRVWTNSALGAGLLDRSLIGVPGGVDAFGAASAAQTAAEGYTDTREAAIRADAAGDYAPLSSVFSVVDNGDGTATLTGEGVVDNSDGTVTIGA